MIPPRLRRLFQCPACRGPLEFSANEVQCSSEPSHVFRELDGFLSFLEPGPGKYDEEYASRYAGLWAFGYETLHVGLVEPLYRSVASLVAESLVGTHARETDPIIVDAGCGVGRVAADCARLTSTGVVLGFDASTCMLRLARRIATEPETVRLALPKYGFGDLSIAGRGCGNILLTHGDVDRLPLAEASADVFLSINVIDRLPGGPQPAFEEAARILRSGATLVFSDPLNSEPRTCPDAQEVGLRVLRGRETRQLR